MISLITVGRPEILLSDGIHQQLDTFAFSVGAAETPVANAWNAMRRPKLRTVGIGCFNLGPTARRAASSAPSQLELGVQMLQLDTSVAGGIGSRGIVMRECRVRIWRGRASCRVLAYNAIRTAQRAGSPRRQEKPYRAKLILCSSRREHSAWPPSRYRRSALRAGWPPFAARDVV